MIWRFLLEVVEVGAKAVEAVEAAEMLCDESCCWMGKLMHLIPLRGRLSPASYLWTLLLSLNGLAVEQRGNGAETLLDGFCRSRSGYDGHNCSIE